MDMQALDLRPLRESDVAAGFDSERGSGGESWRDEGYMRHNKISRYGSISFTFNGLLSTNMDSVPSKTLSTTMSTQH
jgi:hypothetical protein